MNSPLIAIVDDDEALCASLVDLLRSVGYRAEPFFRADTFLAAPDRSRYDCVIADVRMPGTSGLDLVRKLRERSERTPVILITALPGSRLEDEAISAGADCLFRKPLETQVVLDHVARSLSRGRFPR